MSLDRTVANRWLLVNMGGRGRKHLKTLRTVCLLASESQKMWPEEGQSENAM